MARPPCGAGRAAGSTDSECVPSGRAPSRRRALSSRHPGAHRCSMTTTKKTAERLIKKYPNRRLYDTE
ncbi:polyhydroxyalkanoate synthesis regulator DNA-binding domain-containing protein, partial [Burkholderia ambifaria]|uniref:polyhydroxyalkanoate synthesis regulator DNA-binding domain-containing protein n=1 Tax=Burkholderia ambifaria TaxID=152480 RepID=UPI003C7AB5D8